MADEEKTTGSQSVDYGSFGVVTYAHDGDDWKVVQHVEATGFEAVTKQAAGRKIATVEKARAAWLKEKAGE